MTIFLAFTVGMCVFVTTWALGMNPDVGGLIALCFLGGGVAIHVFTPSSDSS